MSQEPWRVRLTGSTAGTLDQVIVNVELIDRAKLIPAGLFAIGGKEYWYSSGTNFEDPGGIFTTDG